MAYDEVVVPITLPSNATSLVGKELCLVKVTNDNGVGKLELNGNGQRAIGVLYEVLGATEDSPCTVAIGGLVKVKAGDTVTAGAAFASDANGLAVPVATGDQPLGIVINGGVVNDIVTVLFHPVGTT